MVLERGLGVRDGGCAICRSWFEIILVCLFPSHVFFFFVISLLISNISSYPLSFPSWTVFLLIFLSLSSLS